MGNDQSWSQHDVPYGGYVRSETESPSRRLTISGRAEREEPPGVNIERGQLRADNVTRDRFLSHLHEMHAAGRLPDDVYEARAAAAEAAPTVADLQLLAADLPPLEPTKAQQEAEAKAETSEKREKSSLKYRWEHSVSMRMRSYAAGIGLSAAFAIVGTVIGGNLTHVSYALKAAIMAPCICIGVAGVAWSLIMLGTDPFWKRSYEENSKFKRSWKS